MKRRSINPQAAEDAIPLLESMSSSNWSTRHDSITDLVQFVHSKPKVVSAQSVKVCLAGLPNESQNVTLNVFHSFKKFY